MSNIDETEPGYLGNTEPGYSIDSNDSENKDDTPDTTEDGYDFISSDSFITEYIVIYENMRYYPFIGWSSQLLPTDRNRFSNENGTLSYKLIDDSEETGIYRFNYVLSDNYIWIDTNWSILHDNIEDQEGWLYNTDFKKNDYHNSQSLDTVRRRSWIRKCGIRMTGKFEYLKWLSIKTPRDTKCKELINRWISLSGSYNKMKSSPISYLQYSDIAYEVAVSRKEMIANNLNYNNSNLNNSSGNELEERKQNSIYDDFEQIDRDIHRTESCGFSIPCLRALLEEDDIGDAGKLYQEDDENAPLNKLRRVLNAYACRNIHVGYVQGLNFVVRLLLALTDEETSFWLLATLVEDIRLPDFYSRMPVGMAGLRAEISLIRGMIGNPSNAKNIGLSNLVSNVGLDEIDAIIETAAPRFLIPLFLNAVPLDTTLFILDRFFVRSIPAPVEHYLDTPLFEIILLLLQDSTKLLIAEPECRTHVFLDYMKHDLFNMVSNSKMKHPDARELKAMLCTARGELLQEWLHSDSFLRSEYSFTPVQLNCFANVFNTLAFSFSRQASRRGMINSKCATPLTNPDVSIPSQKSTKKLSEPTIIEEESEPVDQEKVDLIEKAIDALNECLQEKRSINYDALSKIVEANQNSELMPELVCKLADNAEVLPVATRKEAFLASDNIFKELRSFVAEINPPSASLPYASSAPVSSQKVILPSNPHHGRSNTTVSSIISSKSPPELRYARAASNAPLPISTNTHVSIPGFEITSPSNSCLSDFELVTTKYSIYGISAIQLLEIFSASNFLKCLKPDMMQRVTERLFNIADADHDGEIDVREFLSLVSVLKTVDSRILFLILDINCSGCIERPEVEEFMPFLMELGNNTWLDDMTKDSNRCNFLTFQKEIKVNENFMLTSLSFPPMEEEGWEFERYIRGWSTSNLLKTDPVTCNLDDIKIPTGWEWEDQWHLDYTNSDDDGWQYSTAFIAKPWTDEKNNSAYCRRRRWVRTKLFLIDIFAMESLPSEIERIREAHTEKRKLREKNLKSKRESEEKVHIDSNNNSVNMNKAKNVGF